MNLIPSKETFFSTSFKAAQWLITVGAACGIIWSVISYTGLTPITESRAQTLINEKISQLPSKQEIDKLNQKLEEQKNLNIELENTIRQLENLQTRLDERSRRTLELQNQFLFELRKQTQ